MTDKHIIFLDRVHPLVWDSLLKAGYNCLDHSKSSIEDLKEDFTNAHGLIVRHRLCLDEKLLQDATSLRWIARSGAGLDKIDLKYCKTRGVKVLNAAGGNADAVGEHVIGMLLNLLNHQKRADIEVRQGLWKREANRGRELGAMTLGIIGYGNTGRSLAKKLSGFGTQVLAYDKYTEVDGPHAHSASLSEIKSSADIVSFHVPLNEETHHYFEKEFLESMSRPFYLINASRGGVAETKVIAEGIRSGKILGAALDVLEEEGLDLDVLKTDDPALRYLFASDKTLFSPHIAGWTVESYVNLAKVMVERILSLDTTS